MTDTPPPQDPDDADRNDLDDEPLLVDQLNLHAGTALDRQGRALGASGWLTEKGRAWLVEHGPNEGVGL